MNIEKLEVGIVGGTGYTGVELLRLLARHPKVSLRMITSRSKTGTAVAEVFPSLRGAVSLRYSKPDLDALSTCDLVFFATPNGTAMQMVPDLLSEEVRVVDLAADFRLKDPTQWQHWYGMPHHCPDYLTEAVYGLPERYRSAISKARLVANPGCYPTAVQLGFLPLFEENLLATDTLIADCKSGASGAGRNPSLTSLMSEVGEGFKAYGVAGHRHLPEIRQGLEAAAQRPVALCFVPHLVPMVRGIHATLYAKVTDQSVDLQSVFEAYYANEPFVDVLPAGAHPETTSVRGSNLCRIAVHRPQGGDTVVVLVVIDNLVKGAAGQAVQNMNIMYSFAESLGLEGIALFP